MFRDRIVEFPMIFFWGREGEPSEKPRVAEHLDQEERLADGCLMSSGLLPQFGTGTRDTPCKCQVPSCLRGGEFLAAAAVLLGLRLQSRAQIANLKLTWRLPPGPASHMRPCAVTLWTFAYSVSPDFTVHVFPCSASLGGEVFILIMKTSVMCSI